ncbi:pilus assembly protein PilM [candidate division KSB1 bacterium]|nr:pilus assembly protein PilM [candidate division KSB1 bacterium]
MLFSDNPDEASGVVIDIGAKVTNIIFIHEGNLQFAREISTGGDDITNAMVGTITGTEGSVKIDKEEAERLKFIHGIPSDDMLLTTDHGITLNQIASLMRPAIERLTVQIQRSFDYYRTKFPYDEPEKIFLSGGTALLKNIDTFLADGLNKSVEILNPFNKIKIEPGLEEEKNVSDVAPSLSVAVGTAFSDKKGINLLPRELKDKLLFAVQKRILTLAAAVVLFIISTMSFFAFTEYNSVNGELEQARIDRQPSDTNQNIFTVLNNQRIQIIDKQRTDESDYQKFAGTTQIKDYLYLLSMYTPRIISLEEVSIDLTERNTFSLFGRIFTDLSFAEIELSDFFIKLKNTGMFSRISGYETDPAALEIDMALVLENSKWFQINWGLPPSVNYE